MSSRCGMLKKRGGDVLKRMRERYFDLRNETLTYAAGISSPVLGTVVLTGCTVEPSGTNGLTISGAHLPRIFYLEAIDADDRNLWVEALRASAQGRSSTEPEAPDRRPSVQSDASPKLIFQRPGGHGGFNLPADTKVDVDSFILVSVIGRGNFGKVMRVALKDDPDARPLAMKIMRKDIVVSEGVIESTRQEKAILQTINHPFIVKLHFAFQTRERLYLVLDLLSGGELFFHLKAEGRFSVSRARLYAAEIASAMTHLHDLDILYRDLKPENIVLDADGHACLTDFGLAKKGVRAKPARTFCGTPEYLAPEVLQARPYGFAVDWWCFGCVLYEMLSGLPPFYSEDVNTMYDYILKKELTFDSALVPPDAQDLIRRLLERDPAVRLSDGHAVMAHPFFSSIDWAALERREVQPQWRPNPASAHRDLYVERVFTDEFTGLTVVEVLSQLNDADFHGFTFPGRHAIASEEV